ncbi:pyridoxal phosphate-dependent transferase [Xylariaceae sp. FL0804]|nr:pyridoxal phosphate-dependent transferase [Xylariaceae sp. FL0804]
MTSGLPSGNHVNLQLGWPSPDLFPAAELHAATTAVLTDPEACRGAYIYGPSRGHAPLRREVARWLGAAYGRDDVDEARVCVAGGASQNLSNILLRFTDPGGYTRRVCMVEPTYFLACPIFEDCGFAGRMRGVPEDEEGVDVEYLRAALREAEAEEPGPDANAPSARNKTPERGYPKIYRHVIYAVPTFANPSGRTMSLARRRDLVRLAIEHDALIVTDDVYDFLAWPHERALFSGGGEGEGEARRPRIPPRLVDINRDMDPGSKWGNTVSNGSFSKIVGPGARVSWAEATPAFASFLATTGASISGGNPGHLSSVFVEKLLSSGALERHIQKTLIPTYARRYYAMIDAIREHLEPLGVEIVYGKPYSTKNGGGEGDREFQLAGGFFLIISIPKVYPPTQELFKTAMERYDLKFAHGRMFEVKGDAGSRQRSDAGFGRIVRLCWSYHDESAITEGIKRMRDLLVHAKQDTQAV